MAWYRTGTVAVTNGSTGVTGSGTGWIDNIRPGDAFHGPDGVIYEIATVVSDTSLTLATNYGGSTLSGQAYAVQPTPAIIGDLVEQVQSLISTYGGFVTGALAGKFGDGTVAAPAIGFASDPDTGLYRSAANTLALVTGAAAQLILTGGVATGAAVQSSANDATVGKLLKTGAGGLLGPAATDTGSADNYPLGTIVNTGSITETTAASLNLPALGGTGSNARWWDTFTFGVADRAVQIAVEIFGVSTTKGRLFWRVKHDTWQSWNEVQAV